MFSCFKGAGAGAARLPRKQRSDTPTVPTTTSTTSTITDSGRVEQNSGVEDRLSIGGEGSISHRFLGVSTNQQHSALLLGIMTMILFAMLAALGDPIPYKSDLSFEVAWYSLLPAVLWLSLLAASFVFSLIPICKMGSNSKRDLVIPMLLAFAYGVVYICVKAAAFSVSLWGTQKMVGYAFILCYFIIFSLVTGLISYFFFLK